MKTQTKSQSQIQVPNGFEPKQLHVLEAGHEVSKILAHNGFVTKLPAFRISWAQIAEQIGDVCADHGLPPDRIDEKVIVDLALEVQDLLNSQNVLFWEKAIRDFVKESPSFLALTTGNGDLFGELPDEEIHKGISLYDLDAMMAEQPNPEDELLELNAECMLGQFDDDPSPYEGNYSED